LSIEQAVRRTADYDLELAKKMNAERASSRANLPVYKEYPDEGLKWVQLNRPSDFAAESDAMGHSVRGYEPPQGHPDWVEGSGDSGYSGYGLGGWDAIKSGNAKVYSLVDSKGEPHATIEVGKKQKTPTLKEIEEFYSMAETEAKKLPQGYTDSDVYDIATRMVREKSPEFIKQIKGKGNARPVSRYDQYTQDFVKSGNWSNVGDLENTGLIKIYPESELYQSLTKMGMDAPSYATQDEITKLLKQAQVGSYRDASKGKTWINEDHPDYRPDPPPELPPEGMKRGGAVTLEDLAMNYYVPDYNEDDYYEMPMALMPPQQRMSKGGLTQYKECNCHG
jgi:hypothetical protein